MEQTNIMPSEGQQIMINGQPVQVLQMNQATHMLQNGNGQQIMVHAVPSNNPTIQV